METETAAEPIVVDEAENKPFLGFKFGALINSEKSVVFQQLRKTLSTTWIGAERENFRRGLTLDLRQLQSDDDQKVVNVEQILFANGRILHSTEVPVQRARAFSLTF